jgi:hypothetical protein
LTGDADVAHTFVNPDCTVRKDMSWTVRQKDFATAPPDARGERAPAWLLRREVEHGVTV